MITGQFQTGLPSRTSQKTLKRKRQERNNYMCQKQKEMDIDLFFCISNLSHYLFHAESFSVDLA